MKIALLGNGNSIHIRRWAEGLFSKGIEVHLLTCHPIKESYSEGIYLHQLTPLVPIGYILAARRLKKVLKSIQPDLLHAHYVTGYGTLAVLSGFQQLMLSAWGADVYDFPTKSCFHHWLVERNLKNCKAIGSTSHCMLEVVKSISPNLPSIYVTPFGVDTDLFYPHPKSEVTEEQKVRVGTVKLLHNKYGIDTLIRSFALVHDQYRKADMELVIIGNGPEEASLKALVTELGISHLVEFKGYIDNSKVPLALCELDVFVALSRLDSESFGVAAVEANACGLPVVVSDVSGFKEVVVNETTGLIVARDNPQEAAKAIYQLISDTELRTRMGRRGRAHVSEHYSWEASLDRMIYVYKELCNEK
ncbi:lipopolysaccharides biosynthesis glycosyltransferase [Vibrio orientalis CIP 102891 = ATCC 33934]|uniref:Glycosyl transferase n=1 Tax=Vibrio orientalis CIP 102891 = ATCC 33934 TaxID=675816 RepID=C9QDF7_VIBOR|nr:glycosyltransferase [Vibrio orientalis]EEX95059.1 putative glycosyl transferase [Vibrio orientalis CIP 102891 = ATCC 33934]EGU52120.1 lipopolysaccharides biosynthesis glycosyltransferase [Vibrio orientalis CIP 102891 = ATCC 33934]